MKKKKGVIGHFFSNPEVSAILRRAKQVLVNWTVVTKGLPSLETGKNAAKLYGRVFENYIRLFARENPDIDYRTLLVFASILEEIPYEAESAGTTVQSRRQEFVTELASYADHLTLLDERLNGVKERLFMKPLYKRSFQAVIRVYDNGRSSQSEHPSETCQKVKIGFRIPRDILIDLLEKEMA